MPVRRVFCAVAIIFCFLSLGSTRVFAQGDLSWPEWMHVGDTCGPGWTALYFFNPIQGVVAINGTIFYLQRTYPSGGRWYISNMPSGITNIRQIRLIQDKLYAASEGTDVIVSSDSGKTWLFSGLGLVDANDVYADGSGTLRALHDPMKVFARLDTMQCIAQGTANIYLSSDGGLNWISTGVSMVDSFSTGAYADRCQNVYICPNSWGTAFRSTDFGKTWEEVITGSDPGSEFLNGASTVSYITDTAGLFRSTDDGLSWNSVYTVNGGPHLMYVWGPMGEHVAVDWSGNAGAQSMGIWMTTTGGLDDLHSGINMTDSNGALLMQQDTFNVPWELTSTCNPYLIPIALWADVDGLSEKVSLYDSLGDVALLGQTSIDLLIHQEDTIWMMYDPHHPVINAELTFQNHWHCSDWTETRTVHIDAIPKASIVPPVFAASCFPDTEAMLIQLDSCQTLSIDSVVFPHSIDSLFLATSLPDTASIGDRDSLLFVFEPLGPAGTITDSVTVYGHYLGLDSILDDYFYFPHASGVDTDFSLFFTTVPVTVHSLSNAKTLRAVDTALDAGTLAFCAEQDTFAVVRNLSCDTVCIDSASLSGTGFFIMKGSGAACLASGEFDTVWLGTLSDTTGHALLNTDSLMIASDANPPLGPIVLSRKIEYVSWGLHFSAPDSAAAGAAVTYKLLQAGALPAYDTSVDLVLTANDDLLTLNKTDERWVYIYGYHRDSKGVGYYHLHISLPLADSILATLHFMAYQSREMATNISLDSLFISSSHSPFSDCIASELPLPSSEFTIRTSCDGPLLSEALNGLLTIDGVSPNPTSGELLLRYTLRGAPVEGIIELEDALGRNVLEQTAPLLPGPNQSIALDLSKLPAGMYLARLALTGTTRSDVRSERIIKE